MSLSDCANCWDTPCTCGKEGYISVFPNDKLAPTLINLSKAEFESIRQKMKNLLNTELKLIESKRN